MDNPETKSSPPAGTPELRQQLEALNHLVVSVLILVVIVSGTLTIFLLRQWQSTRKDLAGYKPRASATIAQYTKQGAAGMDGFINRLGDYGKSHPDFKPVLMKYGLVQATSTVPVTATPQKK